VYDRSQNDPKPSAQSSDLSSKLAAIEKAIEEKRKELGVPGVAVVIIEDDKVVLQKGFGLRDVERNLPVNPATLFAIGSCTKAFTAMAAVIGADEGKLSLDDSPKKYLPYFKLQDPDADAKITVRDLLHHSSGLDGTDIAWYTGALTREEVIKVTGLAKPTAKFREKFQYQNVMYSAAGEVVAKSEKSTWEKTIANRFFKPLGMKSSNTSVKEMQKTADFASGYNIKEKVAAKVPMRDLASIAPAGAINSNVEDMAQWVRLMLGSGVFEGKRLVSERGFEEITRKHIAMGTSDYALGWMLSRWGGQKLLSHGGGIDGFTSLVSLMPERKIGLVILTNVSGSTLPQSVQDAIYSNLVNKPQPVVAEAGVSEPPGDPKSEVGKYSSGGITIEVVLKEGKLFGIAPAQPEYPLTNIGGRKYKIGSPAPDGFFITFRPIKGRETETEMYLEQPQGNLVLSKETSAAGTAVTSYSGPHKELFGKYDRSGTTIEIKVHNEKTVLVIPGQPAYTLIEKEKDNFGAAELPDGYRLIVKRDNSGGVAGILIKQPEGEFELKRINETAEQKISLSVDDLMAKVIIAAGGEANLRKHRAMIVTSVLEFENQGITGDSTAFAQAPNAATTNITLMALGKRIGSFRSYYDGTNGGEEMSFADAEILKDKRLEDARIAADFYGQLNWKTLFKDVRIKEISKVGDDEVYVVVKTPEKGNVVTDYISAKTFLLVKRDSAISIGADQGTMSVSETFSDFRTVDGMVIPFQSVTQHPSLGRIVSRVKDVKFDVVIPDDTFRALTKK